MKLFVKSILVFFLFLLIAVLVTVFFLGYNRVLDFFVSFTNSANYKEKIYRLVSLKSFHLLQILCLGPILFLSLLIFYFDKFYHYLSYYVSDFIYSLKRALINVKTSEAKYILILPIATTLYYAIFQPISYDEASTYLNYTSKNLITSISYYPVPNNHVLNSIVTNFTTHIPFLGKLFNLRLSTVVSNAFVWILAFSFLIKFFNKNIALIVVAISATLFTCIRFGYMARGYALLSVFFIVALYFSFKIIKGDNANRNWVWFSVASILGMYTIPTFLYPLATLNVLILVCNAKKIRPLIVANIVIGSVAFLLYLPIIIVNGSQALISNSAVKPISRSDVLHRLPQYLGDAITEIFGVSYIIILSLLVLALLYLLYKKEKNTIVIFLTFIILPPVILLIHSVIPFSRTFIYYGFLLTLFIFLPYKEWLNAVKIKFLLPVVIVIQCLLVYNFRHEILNYEDYSIVAKKTLQEINIDKKITCNAWQFNSLLLFEIESKKINRDNVKCFDNIKMSADTIQNQDYIILEKDVDETKLKVPKITTTYYSVY